MAYYLWKLYSFFLNTLCFTPLLIDFPSPCLKYLSRPGGTSSLLRERVLFSFSAAHFFLHFFHRRLEAISINENGQKKCLEIASFWKKSKSLKLLCRIYWSGKFPTWKLLSWRHHLTAFRPLWCGISWAESHFIVGKCDEHTEFFIFKHFLLHWDAWVKVRWFDLYDTKIAKIYSVKHILFTSIRLNS